MSTELCQIAFKYGTDKCPEIKHNYTPFYYELLKDRRESVKKVLELGVGCSETMPWNKDYVVGAGLRMWRDFFPNARIYGVDILPEAMFEDDRIETFLLDERKGGDLEALIKKTGSDIDLFIDDGSHRAGNQIRVCQTLMPVLKKDVIYIIEDVWSPEDVIKELAEYDCEVPTLAADGQRRKGDNLVIVKNKK